MNRQTVVFFVIATLTLICFVPFLAVILGEGLLPIYIDPNRTVEGSAKVWGLVISVIVLGGLALVWNWHHKNRIPQVVITFRKTGLTLIGVGLGSLALSVAFLPDFNTPDEDTLKRLKNVLSWSVWLSVGGAFIALVTLPSFWANDVKQEELDAQRAEKDKEISQLRIDLKVQTDITRELMKPPSWKDLVIFKVRKDGRS